MSIVYGERLRLRRVERDDVRKYHEWVNDPEVTEGLALFLPLSIEDEERWYQNTLSRDIQERPFSIEVRTGDGWRLIGNMSFFNLEWTNRCAELGIFIGDKSYWNQGYGKDVVQTLINNLFTSTRVQRIYLKTLDWNIRAQKCFEKCGFQLRGILNRGDHTFKVMAISRDHFGML